MIQNILDEALIERKQAMGFIKKFLHTPLIKVLTGQRRVGKSSILKLFIQHFYTTKSIPLENFFYINKENMEFDHIKTYEDLKKEFQHFRKQIVPGRIFVGIDEIQDISSWEKFVNGILAEYGDKVEIFITGSNAFLLSGALVTYLTGRYMEFPIYPLSFQEFCFFKKEPESRQNFVEYLKYGGLPGIFRMEYSDEVIFSYLFSVYNTIFVKDIIHHNVIKNVAFFEDLYKYTLSNIGNIITGESIKNYLKSQHIAMGNETILNFLHYGQETFLLNKVGSVNPDTKQYFEIYNKYYAGDLGLRNAFVGYTFDKDIGKLMENYVYLELKRHGYEVKIGRLFNKKEIDFIAEKHGIIKYFQVCYLMGDEKTMAREYSPLEEIHNSWEKFVVSFDEIDHGIHNGIKWVSVMNLNTLLSEV